jgi:phosphate transport system permease protein
VTSRPSLLRRCRQWTASGRAGRIATAAALFAVSGALVGAFLNAAHSAITHFGFGFLIGSTWNPATGHLGALPFIVGTLETTAIAMALAVPVGLGCALFLVCFVPTRRRALLSSAIELLAGIPSVVYGLWGLQVLAPWVREYLEPALHAVFDGSVLLSGPQLGVGMLLAGVLLAIMILPTMVSVSRDVLGAVPTQQIDGALALGATRWQAFANVALPASRAGVLGAVALAMGRALGETIAVSMVIGDTPKISASLFAPGDTMTTVLANELTEATEPFHAAALFEIALLLLLISVVVNLCARLFASSIRRRDIPQEEVVWQ